MARKKGKTEDVESLFLTAEELRLIFRYPTIWAFYKSVERGSFPIPTYKIRGRIVADTAAVQRFFAEQRARGIEGVTNLFDELGNADQS